MAVLGPHLCQLALSLALLCCRSPDVARVKAKMVYASSKDTFRQQLDGVQIELQATDASELDLSVLKERALR